jgi:hypothetical protein
MAKFPGPLILRPVKYLSKIGGTRSAPVAMLLAPALVTLRLPMVTDL